MQDLWTTDYGLMSLAVIVITLGMGGYYLRYFIRHVKEDIARNSPPKA
ncbi:MAG: DUF3149 domain-containing protein [Burkholderiaceae bacterium]|nr:MAG: DUF3149 domain-containing protein [Burkholderiaceae bacterium]